RRQKRPPPRPERSAAAPPSSAPRSPRAALARASRSLESSLLLPDRPQRPLEPGARTKQTRLHGRACGVGHLGDLGRHEAVTLREEAGGPLLPGELTDGELQGRGDARAAVVLIGTGGAPQGDALHGEERRPGFP